MIHTTSSFVVAAAAPVCAAAFVAYALRGRRVDDHPLCRQCGFDLHGKPDGSTLCAECGADLTRKRATRTGNRVRRRRVLGVALPALLLSLGWLGVLGYGRAKATDWNRHKPVWWLVREVDGKNPTARDAALTEFARRIAEGTLDPADEDAILDKALAYQADASRPWTPPWGGVVEAAQSAGRLSEERWRRYLLQAVTLTLESGAPASRRGYPLLLRIRRGPDRVAAAGGLAAIQPPGYFPRLYGDRTLFIGDRALPAEFAPGARNVVVAPAGWSHPSPGPKHIADLGGAPGVVVASVVLRNEGLPPDDLPDGRQSARVSLIIRPFARKQEGAWDGLVAQPGERRVHADGTWTLVPPPKVNTDEAFRPGVEAALTVWVTEFGPDSPGGPPRARYQIGCNGVPVNVVYDVFMRYGATTTRVPAGTVFLPRGGQGLLEELDGGAAYWQHDEPETVEVILRPNPAGAPLGVTEVWGGEVVKQVRVKRSGNVPELRLRVPSVTKPVPRG